MRGGPKVNIRVRLVIVLGSWTKRTGLLYVDINNFKGLIKRYKKGFRSFFKRCGTYSHKFTINFSRLIWLIFGIDDQYGKKVKLGKEGTVVAAAPTMLKCQ